jgi:hypothetical protein
MPETKEEVKKVLKISDRCDKCGAQAFVLATGVSGELMFCGHHYMNMQLLNGLIRLLMN